jgi:hypothetical protein
VAVTTFWPQSRAAQSPRHVKRRISASVMDLNITDAAPGSQDWRNGNDVF